MADTLEAEWNNKLSSLAEAQEQYERQTQKQRMLIDAQARREQLLSLAADFPRVWNDPAVEPRERKRILRLLFEDVTLINGEMIQVHARLRGALHAQPHIGQTPTDRPDPKTKPEVVAEIDGLLDRYCDREVGQMF